MNQNLNTLSNNENIINPKYEYLDDLNPKMRQVFEYKHRLFEEDTIKDRIGHHVDRNWYNDGNMGLKPVKLNITAHVGNISLGLQRTTTYNEYSLEGYMNRKKRIDTKSHEPNSKKRGLKYKKSEHSNDFYKKGYLVPGSSSFHIYPEYNPSKSFIIRKSRLLSKQELSFQEPFETFNLDRLNTTYTITKTLKSLSSKDSNRVNTINNDNDQLVNYEEFVNDDIKTKYVDKLKLNENDDYSEHQEIRLDDEAEEIIYNKNHNKDIAQTRLDILKKYRINSKSKFEFYKNEIHQVTKLADFEKEIKNTKRIPLIKKYFDVDKKFNWNTTKTNATDIRKPIVISKMNYSTSRSNNPCNTFEKCLFKLKNNIVN